MQRDLFVCFTQRLICLLHTERLVSSLHTERLFCSLHTDWFVCFVQRDSFVTLMKSLKWCWFLFCPYLSYTVMLKFFTLKCLVITRVLCEDSVCAQLKKIKNETRHSTHIPNTPGIQHSACNWIIAFSFLSVWLLFCHFLKTNLPYLFLYCHIKLAFLLTIYVFGSCLYCVFELWAVFLFPEWCSDTPE